MPTIVVDTNILIASLFNKSSASAKIVDSVQNGRIHNAWTAQIRKEAKLIVGRVKRPLNITGDDVEKFLDSIFKPEQKIKNPPQVNVVEDDPDDDKFLACAIAADANVIVSNDEHLLSIGMYEGVQIMNSSVFVNQHIKKADNR